jgi:hypothetical protein
MKISFTILLICSVAGVVICGACSRKTDAGSELSKAANALEQAPVPAPAPAQPEVAQPVLAQPSPVPAPAQEMKQALAAYKGGNLEDAVTRLQKLRATRAMTPQQRIALNDAMAAVMTEIYDLAAKGDARAIQAVAQYERMQTRR